MWTSHSGRTDGDTETIILQVWGKALLSFYDGSVQGSNYGVHVCDCHYEDDGCIQEENRHNTCNCDANLPEQFTDTGTITNTSALPVARLFFGGLSYEMQEGAFKLGRLKCYGEKKAQPPKL